MRAKPCTAVIVAATGSRDFTSLCQAKIFSGITVYTSLGSNPRTASEQTAPKTHTISFGTLTHVSATWNMPTQNEQTHP